LSCVVFFFFFQAEDGIRDRTVTGVQTCALPISWAGPASRSGSAPPFAPRRAAATTSHDPLRDAGPAHGPARRRQRARQPAVAQESRAARLPRPVAQARAGPRPPDRAAVGR